MPEHQALPSHYWVDLSTRDFADLSTTDTIAVLPTGATEQHGPHLPVGVDTLLVEGVVAASLPHIPPQVPVLFLPTLAIGLSIEHTAFPGTLTLQNETILRLWTDIGASVAKSGIRKLVLFNAHGGHVSVMDMVARDLRAKWSLQVHGVSWFNLPLIDENGQDISALFSPEEHRFGIHAGEIETSMTLALDPGHVDMSRARYFHSTAEDRATRFDILGNGRSAKLGWQIQDYNPEGAAGNAAAATADKGKMLLSAAGRALARLLTEIHSLEIPICPHKIHPGSQSP